MSCFHIFQIDSDSIESLKISQFCYFNQISKWIFIYLFLEYKYPVLFSGEYLMNNWDTNPFDVRLLIEQLMEGKDWLFFVE